MKEPFQSRSSGTVATAEGGKAVGGFLVSSFSSCFALSERRVLIRKRQLLNPPPRSHADSDCSVFAHSAGTLAGSVSVLASTSRADTMEEEVC